MEDGSVPRRQLPTLSTVKSSATLDMSFLRQPTVLRNAAQQPIGCGVTTIHSTQLAPVRSFGRVFVELSFSLAGVFLEGTVLDTKLSFASNCQVLTPTEHQEIAVSFLGMLAYEHVCLSDEGIPSRHIDETTISCGVEDPDLDLVADLLIERFAEDNVTLAVVLSSAKSSNATASKNKRVFNTTDQETEDPGTPRGYLSPTSQLAQNLFIPETTLTPVLLSGTEIDCPLGTVRKDGTLSCGENYIKPLCLHLTFVSVQRSVHLAPTQMLMNASHVMMALISRNQARLHALNAMVQGTTPQLASTDIQLSTHLTPLYSLPVHHSP
jgi:hypothetical protein